MNPSHPQGPPGAHRPHPHGRHPASHPAHPSHQPHPPGPSHRTHGDQHRLAEYRRRRRQGGFRPWLTSLGRTLLRTRRGNFSRAKIITLALASVGVIYLLLVRGFFPFDVASPWIESALEAQLGPGHRVSIGSTRLDHDENGAPVLRVNRIRVRGPGNKVIASAPSAEVGLDGSSLMVGSFRARRIDLVGAQTTVRVGVDGRVSIAAGADATPITPDDTPVADRESAAPPSAAGSKAPRPVPAGVVRPPPFHYPQLARWLESFEKSGLDGVALTQIGLKQGTLVVENAETGRTWSFRDINIQLARQPEGGLLFSLASSGGAGRPWNLTATIGAVHENARPIDIVANNLQPGDIMLAAGLGNVDFLAETPLSGIMRAHLGRDGELVSAAFRAAASGGLVGRASDPETHVTVNSVQVQAHFDRERRATIVDSAMIQVGPNRLGFSAVIEAPRDSGGRWPVTVPEGLLSLSTGRSGEAPLVLDRLSVRAVYDPALQRLIIEQGNLAGATTGGAFSGSITFDERPMLALGIAASQMPVSAAKRLWPAQIARGTRGWAMERIEQGIIDRLLIALNVPLDAIGKADVDLPDPAVRFEMTASGAAFRPTADLPLVRDAQVTAVVTGRTARVRMSRGVMDTPQGRRIAVSDGVLEVTDHVPPNPVGTISFRFDTQADAATEMLTTDLLRGTAGFNFEPGTTKGAVSANVQISLVFRKDIRGEEVDYRAEGEVTGFGADRVVRGQRVENVNAKAVVTRDLVEAKGEARIAGAPASFEYRKLKAKPDADFRLTATLDDGARARFGVDLAPWLTGPVGIKAQGRITDKELRIDVENDLTGAKVADLVPGWQKPAGRAAKATYRVIERDNGVRFEDLHVSGGGTTLRGTLDLDGDGNFVSANLPTFHLSDGDKASLRADRTADGALRVSVRGDVLDARGAIRGMTEGPGQGTPDRPQRQRDLDLELRLGAATGFNGEVARQLDMRLLRRNSEIRAFSLVGRIGRDASMVGELRARESGKPVLYVTSGDAGALFRFADFYTKLYGGEAWVLIDPPSADGAPQDGIVSVREFTIRGEPGLDRMQQAAPADATDPRAGGRPAAAQGIAFLRMQVEFSRTPGKFNIREGVIFGPSIGATVDGLLDYAANRVHLRGTYVPAFALNNLFVNLPIVGPFLGDRKEGLIGITFEIVGPVTGPTLRVNPMSAAAPGLFRKLFEFRGAPTGPPAAQYPPQASDRQ